ncbi:hypothetical protein DYQ86_07475 [Acidobacteria bacterium AB60]|nr:hypothetical protein DYQ86_07475 [Acidobacteria bacterium AB60]
MRISPAAYVLLLALVGGTGSAQTAPAAPASGGPQPAAGAPGKSGAPDAAPAAASPVNTPSSLLRPSLSAVQEALNNLKLDKWKKGSVRDEAGDHVNSLLKDMQANLPPLMAAADAAPTSVSQALPLTKHLDAFYAVLLRVEEAARVIAPGDQIPPLQQALLQLNQSRLALDDRLQAEAAAQEKQMVEMQSSLKAAQQAVAQAKSAAAATPAQTCKPATPAKKKTTKKPAPTAAPNTPAKPAASQPASPSGTQQAKPAAGQPQGQKSPAQGQQQKPQ